MDTHDDPFRLSWQQLITELENLVTDESRRCGAFWVRSTKLAELFDRKYRVSLADVAKAQGYDSLRSFLRCSRCFAIYPTAIPQEFHITLSKYVIPNFDQTSIGLIPYRIKKPFSVDPNLIRMIQEEGGEDVSLPPFQFVPTWRQSPPVCANQPIALPDIITTVDDLETAIAAIVKGCLRDRHQPCVTVAMLSQQFRVAYQEPIRVAIRRVCPDMRLIDLLQTMPQLQVQGVDHTAQITLKDQD